MNRDNCFFKILTPDRIILFVVGLLGYTLFVLNIRNNIIKGSIW